MKTALEWFETLNEPERSQAIEIFKSGRYKTSFTRTEYKSAEDAVRCEIHWEATEILGQGVRYWNKIAESLGSGTYQFSTVTRANRRRLVC